MTWDANKIRTELRVNRKPMVIFTSNDWRNMTLHRAAQLDGDFEVQEFPHEIRVWDSYKRRKTDQTP